MSEASKLNWFFLVGAAACFLAGLSHFLLYQRLAVGGYELLGAGGYLFLGAYLALAAIGALQAKGSVKYRLASLFALIGGLSCLASVVLWAFANRVK